MSYQGQILTKEKKAMKTNETAQGRMLWPARAGGLLLMLLACGAAARGQWTPFSTPAYELAGNFSYARAYANNGGSSFDLIGGSAEFTYNFTHYFGVTADGGGYVFRNLPGGLTSNMYTYVGGPKWTFRNNKRVTPYVQGQVGYGRLTAGTNGITAGENGLVVLAGGGIDVPLSHGLAIRAGQVDYMMTRFPLNSGASGTQHSVRISVGLVFRFGDK